MGCFWGRLNEFNPNLNFTHEKSDRKINFLDVIMNIENNKIVKYFFCEPADGHHYLHYNSCRPKRVKTSVVYSVLNV